MKVGNARTFWAAMYERKKDRLRSPCLAACIKERSPDLKGRAPPNRPRGRASTDAYSSKLAPTMGPTTTTFEQHNKAFFALLASMRQGAPWFDESNDL
eukprot:1139891-Pelagomonas_calceolata.AAC.1